MSHWKATLLSTRDAKGSVDIRVDMKRARSFRGARLSRDVALESDTPFPRHAALESDTPLTMAAGSRG